MSWEGDQPRKNMVYAYMTMLKADSDGDYLRGDQIGHVVDLIQTRALPSERSCDLVYEHSPSETSTDMLVSAMCRRGR
jgi:hypothetical protein